MRKKLICAAAITALLATPALAQQKPVPRYGETDKDKTRSEIEADKAAERAYKSSLGNIPAKPDVDPWGGARSAEKPAVRSDAKSAAKSAAPARPKAPKPAATAN